MPVAKTMAFFFFFFFFFWIQAHWMIHCDQNFTERDLHEYLKRTKTIDNTPRILAHGMDTLRRLKENDLCYHLSCSQSMEKGPR